MLSLMGTALFFL